MLEIGSKAPDFTALNDKGERISLSEFLGKKVILYFYPKDDTPGCTREACDFRDNIKKFKKNNVVILGVSIDSVESHLKFKEKFDLPFSLIADEDKKIVNMYEVYKEKNMYGKKSLGVERTTFVINEEGNIINIFPKVKVDNHIQEILENL